MAKNISTKEKKALRGVKKPLQKHKTKRESSPIAKNDKYIGRDFSKLTLIEQ